MAGVCQGAEGDTAMMAEGLTSPEEEQGRGSVSRVI
jgi:hypothetical protein